MSLQAAQAAITQAQTLTANGKIGEARRTLINALNATQSADARAQVTVALAAFHRSQGNFLDAAIAYGETSKIAGPMPELILSEARCWTSGAKPLKAIERLKDMPDEAMGSYDYLSILADAQRRANHWEDAVPTARAALKVKPSSRNMKIILASALGRLNQWEEADQLFDELGPDSPLCIEMKSAALIECGRTEEAASLLRLAVADQPTHARLHKGLAMLLWMQGDKTNFAETLLQAADDHPEDMDLTLSAADMLRRADRHVDALARLEAASTRLPSPAMESAVAILLAPAGRAEEGAELAEKSVQGAPETDWIRRNAACALLAAGQFEAAARHTAWGLQRDPTDQEWISLDVVARRGLGDETYRYLYDYDRFVQPFDLDPPEGYDTIESFLEALATRLRELHVFKNHPLDQSLRGGSQLVLNPDVPQDPLIELFFKALDKPIRGYMAHIGNDPSHPYTARNTGEYDLQGAWSVRLTQGGSHVNHIHSEGWISSAFYVSVPDDVTPDAATDDGWITFGEPRFPVPGISYEKKVCPKVGRLVLFPSYMWHGVRPFHQGEERMTIAFDIIPA
ncbi:putative 2OG-Fe(II) oxygenase [Hyphomonas pacifica]|uniref:putative 2OG-Fe(II) oxygenase n=1 Tax=Hyphomonas pacifica TaxID=1280941 RepID=UPI000DBF6823|nr:putative 2OG-Fe(II) oxygenase [Hyphomonas pacifica]RAN36596.1 hypothetical protein HY11_11665 [Hyphomonas pacifica]